MLVDRAAPRQARSWPARSRTGTGRTIVGETTFGKGTVQQWIELQDNGALKLTIAKWLTPDKRWIHHVGIVPDVVVAPPDEPAADEDPVLDKAVEYLTAADGEPSSARPEPRPPLARAPTFGYGFRERKEVMCSDRQYV